jgi:hypothetical protein
MTWVSSLANSLGVVTLLLIIIIGGYRRWWVFGWLYDQKVQEVEFLRQSNQKMLDLSGRGVAVATRALSETTPAGAGS